MNIALLDQKQNDLNVLYRHCLKYQRDSSIFAFSSGTELLKSCENRHYDVVFWDIDVTEPNSHTAASYFADNHSTTLIYTVRSLDNVIKTSPFFYQHLIKPIPYESFKAVMDICMNSHKSPTLEIKQKNGSIIYQNIYSIVYFESIKHDIILHTNNNKVIKTHGTITEYITLLQKFSFVQCHKSYCVNLNYITSIKNNLVTLNFSLQPVPIGRSRKAELMDALQKYRQCINPHNQLQK